MEFFYCNKGVHSIPDALEAGWHDVTNEKCTILERAVSDFNEGADGSMTLKPCNLNVQIGYHGIVLAATAMCGNCKRWVRDQY